MKSLPIIDMHQDLMLYEEHPELFPNDTKRQTGFAENATGGSRVVVATAFPHVTDDAYLSPETNQIIENDLKAYGERCAANSNWSIIREQDDVTRALSNDAPRGLIVHVEGLNSFVDDAEHWALLERWYALGLRSVGIVWNLTNSLGGGTLDAVQGLTSLGRTVIEWLEQKGMIVDFAHMNEATFWDAAKLVKRSIVVSHGNARSLCDDPRNYSDDQLRAVAASGGIVGVFFSKKFLVKGRDATIADVVDHIDHLVSVMGIDHVGVGTDFGGIISGFPRGLESIIDMGVLWKELAQRGYGKADIEKIASGNALRVLGSLLGSSNQHI